MTPDQERRLVEAAEKAGGALALIGITLSLLVVAVLLVAVVL